MVEHCGDSSVDMLKSVFGLWHRTPNTNNIDPGTAK